MVKYPCSLYNIISMDYVQYKMEYFDQRVKNLTPVSVVFNRQVKKLTRRLEIINNMIRAWDGLMACGGIQEYSAYEIETLVKMKIEFLNSLELLNARLDMHNDDCFRELDHLSQRQQEELPLTLTPISKRLEDFSDASRKNSSHSHDSQN